jgi:putative hydrolase of the HAD superfamily
MLEAVTFDYWRTLIWEPPGELERARILQWLRILTECGVSMSAARLSEAHAVAFEHASVCWRRNEQYRVEHATAEMLAHLDLAPDAAVHEALVEAFSQAGLRSDLRVADGVEDALQRLKGAGVQVGIVCDVGLTPSAVLREHLRRNGLLNYFDHWSFSDESGAYKPSSLPFRDAAAGLGVAFAKMAHVGDQRRTDVVGALGVGMMSVRYSGIFDDRDTRYPEGHVVVPDHAGLAVAIGL